MPGGGPDDVECDEKSFQSAIDLFSDPDQIENMTQAQLDQVLRNALANKEDWMFDKNVSADKL